MVQIHSPRPTLLERSIEFPAASLRFKPAVKKVVDPISLAIPLRFLS